jgi:hypothetical protein
MQDLRFISCCCEEGYLPEHNALYSEFVENNGRFGRALSPYSGSKNKTGKKPA